MTVFGRPYQTNRQGADFRAAGHAADFGVAERTGQNTGLGGLGHRLLGRDVDVLALARAVAFV